MSHVATLVSNPVRPAVDAAAIAKARALLPNAISETVLKPGVAADIFFAPGPDSEARELSDLVRAALTPAPIDVVVQETAFRRKKLFVADMDSTMIDQECIDELADYAGLKAHVAAITERAMRGELPFEPALRERVALLKDLPLAVIGETIAKKITLAAGGRELIAALKANGVYTCLVSGGFTLFTNVIAEKLGFDENRANELIVENGRLAGKVKEPILGRAAKLATLQELTKKFGIRPEETVAIGDGANDLDMITAAGLGIAIHAKPAVAAAAQARIDHADLSAIIYCGGFAA
ncbi:MAG: phosphoserine phosphatase SerB [Xanthobacteraceae bacterium]|nr:phosphoserine phosphatase SerB [Xanthobacteraceae bacterium]MBX3533503.1 phosphoserine phosphatase SerB [Xanthobacteraceae bacterium]MCW5676443.1 phosphoserine phosphatase SerB [Xanthobacteraceae bacterium]